VRREGGEHEAWAKAATELGIDVVTPFFLSAVGIEYVALIRDFGRGTGTVVLAFGSENVAVGVDAAKEAGYYCSTLNAAVYSSYDRALFIEMLDDWGWYGDPDRARVVSRQCSITSQRPLSLPLARCDRSAAPSVDPVQMFVDADTQHGQREARGARREARGARPRREPGGGTRAELTTEGMGSGSSPNDGNSSRGRCPLSPATDHDEAWWLAF
jgi:hypothetical protein